MERYKWHKRSHLQSRDRGAGVESTTREAPRTLQWALFPSTGGLPDSGVEPRSPGLQADSLSSVPPGTAKYTDTKGERGWNWEMGTDTRTLLAYVWSRHRVRTRLMHCADREQGETRKGAGVCMCICVAESFCCAAETNTTRQTTILQQKLILK